MTLRQHLSALGLFLLISVNGWGAVAPSFSGTPFATANSVTSLSFNFTITAGSNLCLIAVLQTDAQITSTSMSWNGTPMTSTGSGISSSARGYVEIFRLTAPTAGTHALAASWTTTANPVLTGVAFSGADQTTCVKTADNQTLIGGTSPATGTITSTTDGATVAAFNNISDTFTATLTQTEVTRTTNVDEQAAVSYGIGGASNTHSVSIASDQLWDGLGVHVIAAGASPTGNSRFLTLWVGD